MSELNHVGLWNRCLEIIRDNVPEQTYKTWFLPIIPLKYEDKTLVVQVPSQFFYEFLEDKLDRKSTRLNSSHYQQSRMPSSA